MRPHSEPAEGGSRAGVVTSGLSSLEQIGAMRPFAALGGPAQQTMHARACRSRLAPGR
ncbi:MAG TPA: hypothetical protein PLZ50_04980 [Rubrivivax sp.]|nr:hypothetical protein [Rubrivivax sp.]